MNKKNDQGAQKSLGYVIQSQHPGITNEIQGAINTLRKLQKITNSSVVDGPAAAPPNSNATIEHHSSVEDGDADFVVHTPAAPAGGVPVLSACESFGRYQIARQLGRGAMGAVYLAYDSQLERYVALKTPFLGDNPLTIQRFYREARATAQLRSPYICPIYDVGQISGIYFISMAFIDGRSLGQVIADGQLRNLDRIAEIVKKIARGLQKAHDQGIIHRDLKPDNIMLDGDGEPIVMDFGLARRMDDEVQITMAGRILGTPAYMSPEQVEGNSKKIGPPTDIYSLGAVLYQMLTMRLPFQGSLTSVLRKVGNEEPPKPSSIAPEVIADSPLERICLKMMAKKISDRYASMADVVAALDGKLSGEQISAAKPSLFKRIAGWLTGRRKSNASEGAPAPANSLSKASTHSSQGEPANKINSANLSQTVQVDSTGLEDMPTGSKTMMVASAEQKGSESSSQTIQVKPTDQPELESGSQTIQVEALNQSALESGSHTIQVEALNQKESGGISQTIQTTSDIQKNAVLDSQTVDLPAEQQG
jgi:serine/threonine protein kinase